MTNCLFAAGIKAVTARLEIRYLQPVEVDCEVELFAELVRSKMGTHYLEGSLSQKSEVRVLALAAFKNRPDDSA